MLFFHFLNSNDKVENSPFLKKIKSYNQDDCVSTKKLYGFLWELKKKHKIPYRPFTEKVSEEKHSRSNIKKDCHEKAQTLLNKIPSSKRNLPLSEMSENKDMYTAALLAHLLNFHIREDKPGWWDYFSRREMNKEEMLEDKNTITFCDWKEGRK